ncbi:MAG: hypothetical protein JXB26_04395 [Candidatus Aminicenantes bacterium]|nr:hypothetical protein [Candidatus Aminicenantes bacterium]
MKLRKNFLLLGFFFIFFSIFSVEAQIGIIDRDAKIKPTLVVLGTYHMGTAGKHLVNVKKDDVTTPERQKQIIELVEKLGKFKPTKIVVEIDIEKDTKTQEIYNEYLEGHYQLSKSETNQIGFRLAKKLGHKKVYCVNGWDLVLDEDSYNFVKYASKDAKLDSFLKGLIQKSQERADKENEKLSTLSVTDQLILLNQPDRMEKDHQVYFDLLRIGRNEEYVGANYVSWWYSRNLMIFTNIIRITDSSDDRILVIYGAGHTQLLTQFAEESGFYIVENPLKYLEKNK